ncbi:MAG TPA: DUF2189 domain-containing protein [Acetobacteraceae bacterium]|jgi:uncharacterized membrane protein|nr:DUF2189 domain-containing protein [Acetobacteraceae bacterium]
MAIRSRSPVEWVWEEVKIAVTAVGSVADNESSAGAAPMVRRIDFADLGLALRRGAADFANFRGDAVFLCLIYPVAGLVFGWLVAGYDILPLIFPLVAGFALIGPLAAVGLNEMSRRSEQREDVTWVDAFGVFRSHAVGKILVLGLLLMMILLLWLVVAGLIYDATLGPKSPASFGAFVHAVFTTNAGWAMIVAGIGVGFLFAVLALAVSVVSFPLLLDRDVRLETAVATSIRAVRTNPVPMAAWGLIVAAGLVVGSIPFLLGLAIVLPVLGHATWHLYRRLIW